MESTLKKTPTEPLAPDTKSAAKIAQLNAFWREVMGTLDSQICVLDTQGRIVEANQKWTDFAAQARMPRAATQGDSFLDYCLAISAYGGKSGSHEVSSAVMAILSGKRSRFKKEYASVVRGEERLLSVRLSQMPAGAFGAVLLVQEDKTELRQHERRLKEARSQAATLASALETSQQSLEFAMRGGNLGLWHWDLNTGYFELTRDWLNSLGYDNLDLQADIQSFRGLLHPDDLVLWTEEDALSIAGDEPYDRQFRLRRKDDSYAWAQALGRTNSQRPNGSPESLSGVLIDIDARKRVELRDAGMAKIIEESLNEIYVFDQETLRFIEVNRGARENLGYSLEELQERMPSDIKIDYDEKSFRERIKPLLTGEKKRLEFEVTHRRKNGTTYPVMVNLQTSQLVGRPVFAAIVLDLSKRKKLEMQLNQAQKLESLGQLAAGVAHEMNTPMQYVGNNIKFLSDCSDELFEVLAAYERYLGINPTGSELPKGLPLELVEVLERTHFERIRKELPNAISESLHGVERVLKIIRTMKEFSHPGGKKMKPTDLNRALTSTVMITQNRWKEVADLQLDLDPELPLVVCDPGSISQVFVNLIVNAVDAIEEKNPSARSEEGGTITVRSQLDGDHVRLEFNDNGCGITEEVCGRVFDPFFTTKDVGQGTGQGLSLCHTIVTQKHSGTIKVESRLGEGTIFYVRLPVRPPDATMEARASQSAGRPSEGPFDPTDGDAESIVASADIHKASK